MDIVFTGGLNEQDDTQVKLEECTAGYNFELSSENTHYRPRKPFDLAGTTTNAAAVNGLLQLVKVDQSVHTLVQSGDTCYKWDGTTFTSHGTVNVSSKLRQVNWALGDYLILTDLNKLTVVKKWDGTTLSTLTTGLGASLFAKFGVVHLGRVWLFNVLSGTDTPHLLVASAFENPILYDTAKRAKDSSFTTGLEAFYMVTPDLLPINGVTLFYNLLVISSENGKLYKLTGTDSKTFAWEPFYEGSSVLSNEAMVDVGDDVIFARKGSAIEALSTTQAYGDVKTDDLSRFIRASSAGMVNPIAVYDQSRQKIYFFLPGKALVLHKDMIRGELSPWSLYKTNHASAFNVISAAYLRDPSPSGTESFVYWGDGNGRIFKMEGTGNGDGSTALISIYRKSVLIRDALLEEDGIKGRIDYKRVAANILNMEFEWADDFAITKCAVPLEGPPVGDSSNYWGGTAYWGGSSYWNSGFFFSKRVASKGFSPVGRGPGLYIHLYVDTNTTFDILRLYDEAGEAA
jgi:hypothetical protein